MKLIRFLVVVGFLAICASAARADGVDPIITTRGCGGTSPCDAVILGPGQTITTVSETFSCSGTTSNTCTAMEAVINDTGASITSFELAFTGATTSTGAPLSLIFSCDDATEGQLFSCQSLGNNTFLFTAGSICTATPDTEDDIIDGVFVPDGDTDDGCGVVIGLTGVNGVDPPPTDPNGNPLLNGATATAIFNTPEPSSALLLLFGLMGGLVSFKFLRITSLA